MTFDVEAFRAAHRPWTLRVGARAYVAQHVSALQVFRYQELAAAAGADRREQERALRWILRKAFPWRFSYLRFGDPVRIILGLEPAARSEALQDFFEALRGGPTNQSQNSRAMNGTLSLTPTSTPRR